MKYRLCLFRFVEFVRFVFLKIKIMLLTHDFWEHELFEFIEWLGLSTECTDETVLGSYPSPLCASPSCIKFPCFGDTLYL